MGSAISSRLLFPASHTTYDHTHPHLVWIRDDQKSLNKDSVESNDLNRSQRQNSGVYRSGRTKNPEEFFPALVIRCADPPGSRHALLYFHGNSCDLGEIYEEMIILHSYLNCHMIAFEYPGYGLKPSGQYPNAALIDHRARTTFNWLTTVCGIQPASIVLFGRSIGTGPAARLASKLVVEEHVKINSLILHCPFLSIHKIVADYSSLGPWVLPDCWNVASYLEKLAPSSLPLLVIHGKNDEVIPVYHGETLLENYTGPKDGWFPDDSQHNSYLIVQDLAVPMGAFLRARTTSLLPFGFSIPYECLSAPAAYKHIVLVDTIPLISLPGNKNHPELNDYKSPSLLSSFVDTATSRSQTLNNHPDDDEPDLQDVIVENVSASAARSSSSAPILHPPSKSLASTFPSSSTLLKKQNENVASIEQPTSSIRQHGTSQGSAPPSSDPPPDESPDSTAINPIVSIDAEPSPSGSALSYLFCSCYPRTPKTTLT